MPLTIKEIVNAVLECPGENVTANAEVRIAQGLISEPEILSVYWSPEHNCVWIDIEEKEESV